MELFKEFGFEAAHRLPRVPDGHRCARLHGHSYRVEVHVAGPVDPVAGWVMDFADIADVVRPVIAGLDHRCLNEIDGLENPTSEVLAMWLWDRLVPDLVGLCRIVVRETASSGCTYTGPDRVTTETVERLTEREETMTDYTDTPVNAPIDGTLGPDAVLGRTARHPVERLDVISIDTDHLDSVTFECAEVASMCPVTEQPDLSSVTVVYRPAGGRIVESKSLKLYLWGFRDRGVFCEGMAQEIAARVWADARPRGVTVTVRQSVRGGIVTTAVASRGDDGRAQSTSG